jgi:hypothetical protein
MQLIEHRSAELDAVAALLAGAPEEAPR